MEQILGHFDIVVLWWFCLQNSSTKTGQAALIPLFLKLFCYSSCMFLMEKNKLLLMNAAWDLMHFQA